MGPWGWPGVAPGQGQGRGRSQGRRLAEAAEATLPGLSPSQLIGLVYKAALDREQGFCSSRLDTVCLSSLLLLLLGRYLLLSL